MLTTQQLKSIYTNEQMVIILLARLYLGTCEKQVVTDFLAGQPIQWNLVLKLARVHGIRSFICHVIVSHGINVKNEFLLNLKKKYTQTKFKNFEQLKTTARLIDEFNKNNIQLIPYKGALFAARYYSDWAARESSDLDFLIDGKDAEAVEQFFKENNYPPVTTVPASYSSYNRKFFKDLVYKDTRINASIEMHWRLMERFSGSYPEYDFFVRHLQPYQTGSFALRALAPTYDFLAVASNHFVKDMNIKFKYLIDMGCMIQKEKAALDMQAIIACAQKYHFEKRLNTGLALVNEILGIELMAAPVPALPEAMLQIPLLPKLYLTRFYINEPRFIRYALQLQDNAWEQVKFLAKCLLYVFMPTYADINELKLPVVFLPLLIVLRPFRLMYLMVKGTVAGKKSDINIE